MIVVQRGAGSAAATRKSARRQGGVSRVTENEPGALSRLQRASMAREQKRLVRSMLLIAYYLVFMIAGDLAAYFIGLVVERAFGGQVSLIVFLALYFFFLWIAWLLAVWFTAPKGTEPVNAGSR
jgi:cation transporter-like permease